MSGDFPQDPASRCHSMFLSYKTHSVAGDLACSQVSHRKILLVKTPMNTLQYAKNLSLPIALFSSHLLLLETL